MRLKFSAEQKVGDDDDEDEDDDGEDAFVTVGLDFDNVGIWQQQCFRLQQQFYE